MNLPRLISTRDVPRQFLQATFLVGSIPFKALQTDSRISYTLYVPQEHLNPDPKLQCTNKTDNLAPAYQLPPLPLVVNIHGTGRNAETCRNRLIPFANSARVAVLAPLFPAGIDSFNDLENYKLLRYKTLHADTALLDILDEVKVRWPGIATEKVFMIGFSGGGQFAQRFLYMHPERLHAVSIGAPGRVTMLDEGLKWPAGIQNVAEVFDGSVIDKSKIRKVKIQLVVGGEDDVIHGGTEFWAWLAKKKESMNERGKSKLASESGKLAVPSQGRASTLKGVQSEWEKDSIRSELTIVDGIKHDSDAVVDAMVGFLRPLLRDIES